MAPPPDELPSLIDDELSRPGQYALGWSGGGVGVLAMGAGMGVDLGGMMFLDRSVGLRAEGTMLLVSGADGSGAPRLGPCLEGGLSYTFRFGPNLRVRPELGAMVAWTTPSASVTGWTGAVGGVHLSFGRPGPEHTFADLFLGGDGGTIRKWDGVWAGGRLDFHVTNRAGIRWGFTVGGTRTTFDVGFDLGRPPWRDDPREPAPAATPDVAPPVPDAAPPVPDAGAISPEAAPPVPDAGATSPEAGPAPEGTPSPEVGPSPSDPASSSPDAPPAEPAAPPNPTPEGA